MSGKPGELPTAPAAKPPGASADSGKTVLLVEDDGGLRRLAIEILSRLGYRVLSAPNGQKALQMLRDLDGRVDILVTDVLMPAMSGPDLVRRSSELRPGMRVLYMSGFSWDAVLDQGYLPEDAPFLQKPFTADALARKLRELLE